MFCPKCSVYLTERELVKRNIKYTMGNVPVEYDARCPNCTNEIGHVFWGKFTPLTGAGLSGVKAEALPVEPEERNEPEKHEETAARTKRVCPHCGQPWPENQ